MKKLALLAVFAGLMAGCCGLFECNKNADGSAASCCGCSHGHGTKGHGGKAAEAEHKTSEHVSKEALSSAEIKSSVPVEGAEMLAETANSIEEAAL